MASLCDGLRPLVFATLVGSQTIAGLQEAAAQVPVRPLQIEDLAAATELSGPATLSPAGNTAAYTACLRREIRLDPKRVDVATNRPAAARTGCSIRVADVATGKSRRVGPGKGETWGPTWSPDGRLLAFYADDGSGPHVWLWQPREGRAWQLTKAIADAREVPVWTSDAKKLLVKLSLSSAADSQAVGRAQASSLAHGDLERGPGPSVAVFHSGSLATRGEVSVRGGGPRRVAEASSWHMASSGALAVITIATGDIRVVAPAVRSNCYRFSPDGSQIAYTDSQGRLGGEEGASTLSYVYDLVVVDVATARAHVIVPGIRQWEGRGFSWSPGGKWLAYLSGTSVSFPDYSGYSVRGNLFVASAFGGESRSFRNANDTPLPSFRILYPEQIPLWDSDGDHIYLTDARRVWRATVSTMELAPITLSTTLIYESILADGDDTRIWTPHTDRRLYFLAEDSVTKQSGIYAADLGDGATTPVWTQDKRVDLVRPSASMTLHWLVMRAQSATESPDLWILDLDSTKIWRLTTLNPRLSGYAFGTSRLVSFYSSDGLPLQAALLLPANYVEGRRYPLVVRVYASNLGSRRLNEFGMDPLPAYNGQMLSTRGYAVLWPDMPVHAGTPLQDVLKAVLPAVDQVVELGIVDPDRIAVMGQSYGGYSTLALLTQTSRFKAGVMVAGVANLVSLYGVATPNGEGTWVSFLEAASGAMQGPPWAVPQRYIENSPIFHLDRVHTPLLMQVGGADQEFVSFSNEIFVGLTRLGRDVTYLRYEGEGHVLQQWPNIVDYWHRLLAFLDDRLTPTNAAADRAPRQ